MKKIITPLYYALITLFISGNSYAALVTQNFTGQFLFVDDLYVSSEVSLNSISLAAVVSGSVSYDDLLVADVGETFLGPVNALLLNFGALSFTETDDLDYGLGPFPDADFMDGVLTGVGFFTDYLDALDETIWELDMSGNIFEFFDFASGSVVASGTFDYAPPPAPIPLPTAFWLFGSGLIGLVGIARRKEKIQH